MGNQEYGTMNENGEMLCDFCGLNDMMKGGTMFAHRHPQTDLDFPKRTGPKPN